jgi:hypothetical protein
VKYVKSVREKMMSFKITEPDLTSVRDDMILALNRSLFLFSAGSDRLSVAFHPNRKSSQVCLPFVRSLARKVEEGPRAAERQASVASPVPPIRVKQRPVRDACWAL